MKPNRTPSILRNASQWVFFSDLVLASVLILGFVLLCVAVEGQPDGNQRGIDADWSALIASMEKMHIDMGAVKPSGNTDGDFVRLMIPHHQAAIEMAKTQLLYGKDAQMRRLAQEIVTDQQLEIELMQRWLKARESAQSKENDRPATGAEKDK